jgi:putative zinc finger/helix-turn-helix YgiT family protein
MTPDTNTGKPRKERDRPFPWTCGNCLKDEVYPETMPYAIDVKHDGQLYHLEIPEIRIPKCRACGELIFSNSEDDQILQALRARVRLLTPEQIRGGRQALGLKSKEIAEKLGVAPETMSRWENGGLIQSRAMDNFLRAYFAVPEVRRVLQGTQQDPSLGTMFCEGGNRMRKGIHKVVLYIHEESKRFTITARMEHSQLPGVNKQMAQQGYTRTVLAEGLDKHEAEAMRDRERKKYVEKGYAYQTRPRLS